MYSPLLFSYFDTTVVFSFLTEQSLFKAILANTSKYLQGYHGLQHTLYAVNTFSHITCPHYKKIGDETLLCPPTEEIPGRQIGEEHNNMVAALIWHDVNYQGIDDDSINTKCAINSLQKAYTEETNLNLYTIAFYIEQLQYPAPSEISDNPEVHILKDCDCSMLLYEDYFSENGLFAKLVQFEFSHLSTESIKDKAYKYIMNREYYTPYLNKVLENIGREKLWASAEHRIDCIRGK